MTNEQIRPAEDGGFEIHDLAGLVPMALEYEQQALTMDIQDNGQRDAIILWKGKVVDGRCRQTALVSLGSRIIYRELSDSLTEDEVATFVKSVNTRRNLTVAQKAMSAAISQLNGRDKRTNRLIASSWGIGNDLLSNAKFIYNNNKQIGNDLFNGKSVDIIDSKGRTTSSNRITAVYAHMKRIQENVKVEDAQYGWSATDYITTQIGREWFYETIDKIKTKELTDVNLLIAELANYKFHN